MKYFSFAALAVVLTRPIDVYAHALPQSQTPAAGSTLTTPPTEVSITFSEQLEPRFSSLQVKDATGARVDSGSPHTAADDAKRFVVNLKPLVAGTYKVIWHATSVDTHKTEGSYDFTVVK
jgi:methionine-rich copper-binding protein CopC